MRGGDADAAGRRLHEDALARAQAAEPDQARPRGRVVHRDRRAGGEVEAVGERNAVARADHHARRVAAEPRAGHDPVADRRARDALPHRGDHARDLVAEHARRVRRVLIQALARHVVGEVHARGPDVDQHSTRPRFRVGPLDDLEGVVAAMAGQDDGAHPRDRTEVAACDGPPHDVPRRRPIDTTERPIESV
jgi:hypothetical protein